MHFSDFKMELGSNKDVWFFNVNVGVSFLFKMMPENNKNKFFLFFIWMFI